MLKFEYYGLNIMDEIASVSIAYDEETRTLHIKDEAYIVWPEYDGNAGYKLSDGFLNMVRNIRSQHMFKAYAELSEGCWIESFTIYFYKAPAIVIFKGYKYYGKIPFNSIKNKNLLVFQEWLK